MTTVTGQSLQKMR